MCACVHRKSYRDAELDYVRKNHPMVGDFFHNTPGKRVRPWSKIILSGFTYPSENQGEVVNIFISRINYDNFLKR